MSDTNTAAVARELAPGGHLRAAINLGNIVLAQRAPDGSLQGVSVALSREIARRLDLALELVAFDAAGQVVAACGAGGWDLAFMACDPQRGEQIDFTAPYVLIEGTYLVAADAPWRSTAELDAPGLRIATSRGAAYDLALQRQLRHATRVSADSPPEAYELFATQGLDALAAVRQPLLRYARADARWRVLDDAFMRIEQTLTVPKGRSRALAWLQDFIAEAKASGLVARALADSGQADTVVAP